jgi:hypothetical protein
MPGAPTHVDPALDAALRRLEADGLATRDGECLRTTRKWQGAMARAALRLYEAGDPGQDLRVPIAAALLDIYGSTVEDEELASLVEAMLPVETASLGLRP